MSQYQNLLRDTIKLKYDASNKRPQSPKFGDELALQKSLAEMQEKYSKPDRDAMNEMLGEISQQNQKNGGGNYGDALISGLKAGIKKGSFLDDKKRLKGIMDFTEKMQGMVSAQNQQLWKEENKFNAQQAVAPRVYGYLESYQTMSPSDRKVYLDNVLKEYNSIAGTNYDLLDTGGADPLKVLVDTGNGAEYLDLMDIVQTGPEKKLDIILKGQEYQAAQKAALAEDSLNNQAKMSAIRANNARANKYDGGGMSDNQHKKQQLIQAGILPEEGGILLDEISDPRIRKMREEELLERAENLDPMIKGLKNLDQMEEIISNNPKLYKDFSRIVEISDEKNPSILNNFYRGFKSKEIAEVQKLSKLANDLVLNEVKAFPGRPTDLIKKTIIKTIADAGNTPESFKLVKDNLSSQYLRVAEDAEKAAAYRKFGVYAPKDTEEQSQYLNEYRKRQSPSGNQAQGSQPSQALDKDALMVRRQQLIEERNRLQQESIR